jgi:hypothetical protein
MNNPPTEVQVVMGSRKKMEEVNLQLSGGVQMVCLHFEVMVKHFEE